MDYQKKLALSELLIRQTFAKYPQNRIQILWSGGKDSTVVLHIIRRLYGNQVPFKLVYADTTYDFPEVYEFIKRLEKEWQLDIFRFISLRPETIAKIEKSKEVKRSWFTRDRAYFAKRYATRDKVQLTVSGIRWYEHFHNISRLYIKHRTTPDMLYPILHWTHEDIWRYTKELNVPYVSLYDQGYTHLDLKIFAKNA